MVSESACSDRHGGQVTTRNSSREDVLNRIRRATAAVAPDASELAKNYAGITRDYVQKGTLSENEKLALLVERLREYDAEVVESTPESLGNKIREKLGASGLQTFAVPAGLPQPWLAAGFRWIVDKGLSHEEIEKVDGVVTAATCAIADSGTIVLHHSANEGRRVLTLLPDWHMCVLFASQVVATLPEYFARVSQPPALVTWISGPSATADIEMTRIRGVHGPRQLCVVLVRD
jgi:L-lactate dehydrogenase complex protein LldG